MNILSWVISVKISNQARTDKVSSPGKSFVIRFIFGLENDQKQNWELQMKPKPLSKPQDTLQLTEKMRIYQSASLHITAQLQP